ncbi:MAG: M20 family metallo-hydrolase [Muribaculaceae bacterium]|nr:M20 family metallo-hydrolase [Muribaculaceae bacterium]
MNDSALRLLDRLIATPSLSRDESVTADIIENELRGCGIAPRRLMNNVWAVCDNYCADMPTLLLNSHHDTVRPSQSYTLDPFSPLHRDGRIYGLGSNDAGGSLVSLVECFKLLRNRPLSVNLVLALTAEEEVSGANGIESLLKHFDETGLKIDMAIVGEPTGMKAAIAERGLVVLDCCARGVSGHAARDEGDNAIIRALDDIALLRSFRFERTSPTLGDVKMTVTQINAGTQHNVIPDRCDFVVDIRTTDAYSNREMVDIINSAMQSDVKARSTRLQASAISCEHPLVKAATLLGIETFVSPTLSDRALMHGIPALKIGPGESSRSHSADEYILECEIDRAIDIYQQIITSL